MLCVLSRAGRGKIFLYMIGGCLVLCRVGRVCGMGSFVLGLVLLLGPWNYYSSYWLQLGLGLGGCTKSQMLLSFEFGFFVILVRLGDNGVRGLGRN